LRLAVIALLLLNLGWVAFFLLRHTPPRHGDTLKKTVIERLHFDAGQAAAYEQLIEEHRRGVRAKEQEMRAARQRLYSVLQGSDLSEKDTLIQRIGLIQTEIEQIHFNHFQEVKKLCRPGQIADFQMLAADLARLLAPLPPPEPGRK